MKPKGDREADMFQRTVGSGLRRTTELGQVDVLIDHIERPAHD